MKYCEEEKRFASLGPGFELTVLIRNDNNNNNNNNNNNSLFDPIMKNTIRNTISENKLRYGHPKNPSGLV